MWYAVQVETGREKAAVELICQHARVAGLEDAFDELFVPMRQTLTVSNGEQQTAIEPLFPGYVIAVAKPRAIERVAEVLRRTPRFTRLLGYDGMFTPLDSGEVQWICAFTQKQQRIVPMSEGFVEGGRVVVARGPLVGKEALIKKVHRRKRIATLEMQLCGRTIEAKVGLNLVRKAAFEPGEKMQK